MKHTSWERRRRFSFRKLAIGLVSATIGFTTIPTVNSGLSVHADEVRQHQQGEQKVEIRYIYMNEEDLTSHQKSLLTKTNFDFEHEIAQSDQEYILVYSKETKQVFLPRTGEIPSVLSLLMGFSIVGLLISVKKRNKQLFFTVCVISATGLSTLTSQDIQALETHLHRFLTATHLVAKGEKLPQPEEIIGDRQFRYYLKLESADFVISKDTQSPDGNGGSATTEPLPTFDLEVDADGDGFSNQDELIAGSNPLDAQSVPATTSQPEEGEATNSTEPLPTFELAADADGDGFSNQDELIAGSNPLDSQSVPATTSQPEEGEEADTTEPLPTFELAADADGDGFSNQDELIAGSNPLDAQSVPATTSQPEEGEATNSTEPLPTFDPEADADGDGFSNQDELTAGSNPLDAQSVPATTSQPEEGEATNSTEPLPTFELAADADGDGYSNQDELTAGSNPLDAQSVPATTSQPEEGEEADTTEPLPAFPMDQVVTKPLHFKTISTDDTELLQGVVEIDTPGENGSISYIIIDGVRHILSETPARDQVQRVGTKPQAQPVTDYYVRNGQYHSTVGTGTQENPFESIKEALAQATDGVTIKLLENIQAISLPNTSQAGKFVINKAVTIDGQGRSLSFRGLSLEMLANVTFKNITLDLLPDGAQNESIIRNQGQTIVFDNVGTRLNNQSTNYPSLVSDGGSVTFKNSTPTTELKTIRLTGATPILHLDHQVRVQNGVMVEGDNATINSTASQVLNYQAIAGTNTILNLTHVSPHSAVTISGIDHLNLDNSSISLSNTSTGVNSLNLKGTTAAPSVLNLNNLDKELTIGSITSDNGKIRLPLTVPLTITEPVTSPLAIDVNDQVTFLNNSYNNRVLVTITDNQDTNLINFTLYPENSGYEIEREGNHFILKAQRQEKTKPNLQLTNLTKNDAQRSIILNYELGDDTEAFTGATVAVYKGTELVVSQDITDPNDLDFVNFSDFESNVEYMVKTSLVYDLDNGQGQQTEILTDQRTFEFVDKKVEFRNVAENELYTVDAAGQLTRVNGLTTAPNQTDLANYVVKIRTSKNKDVYLPVASITDSGDGFTVTATQPELVQFGSDNITKTEGYSFKLGKIVTKPGAYSDFSELIKAMNADPRGTYYLSADMQVPTTSTADATYVTQSFSGSLSSVDETKRFSISGLTKPLFNTLNGATISNISLKNIAIDNTSLKRVGALANTTTGNTSIKDIELQGSIRAGNHIGGLVFSAGTGARIENITAEMIITNTLGHETHQVGGVIAILQGNLQNVSAKVNMTAAVASGSAIGGVVGRNEGTLSNAYANGTISANRTGGNVGGIAGQGSFSWTTFSGSQASNLISAVAVTNGNSLVGTNAGGTFSNVRTVTGQASGAAYAGATAISPEEATTRTATWKATPVQATTTTPVAGTTAPSATARTFNWSSLTKAKPGYETAYENMEKLLPYYDRHTIVKYANKLTNDSKLFTTKLLSAVPMAGTRFAADTLANATINKLFLHFEGNTKEEYDLTDLGNFKTTKIREFSFGDGLLYTPEQFNQVPESTVQNIVNKLTAHTNLTVENLIRFYNIQEEVTNGRVTATKEEAANRLLYLKKPLEAVKAKLADHVKSLISSYASIDLTSDALNRHLTKELTKDVDRLMLGLAHLERSYDVNYGDYNIKNLVIYRPDFDGKKVNVVDYVISMADTANSLKLTDNVRTYDEKLAKVTDTAGLFNFLEKRRQLFLPNKTNEDWFKENTKAFLYEKASEENPNAPHVKIYDKLKNYTAQNGLTLQQAKPYERYLLPLLNLDKEDQIFVLSSMTTLTFGHFGQLADPASAQYAAAVVKAKTQDIPRYMESVNNFLEMWIRFTLPEKKDVLINRQSIVLQSYNVASGTDRRWMVEHGDSYSIVDDFYGPLGLYYPDESQSAYANGRDSVRFLRTNLLTDQGISTTTHELTHNYDREVMLNGHDRRIGHGSESYALGLLQSVSSANDYALGFNSAFDNLSGANHNSSPRLFRTTTDLENYMKGVMDVTYSLDLLELEAIRKLAPSEQSLFFDKLELGTSQTENSGGITYTHTNDRVRNLTSAEWTAIGTAEIDKLIDANALLKDPVGTNGAGGNPTVGKEYVRTDDANYYWLPLTAPIYGGNVNDKGASGGFQFRRTAFELLAAKGWEEGFLPYTTNQLKAEAEASGQPLSDLYILNKVLDGQSYAAFKKAEYAARAAQLDHLKAITINYNGSQHVLNSREDIQRLLDQATARDLTRLKANSNAVTQNRHLLKLAIIKAYNQATKDFRESVYKQP